LTNRDAEEIVVYGGSAGGNLTAALVLRARDEGIPTPAGVILVSPEIDLTESSDTFQTNEGIDHLLHSLMLVNLRYANGHVEYLESHGQRLIEQRAAVIEQEGAGRDDITKLRVQAAYSIRLEPSPITIR
jgi:acetyl esterase/lipase